MMKRKAKCMIPRSVKNPKVFYRWVRLKWSQRVRLIEKELGYKINCC